MRDYLTWLFTTPTAQLSALDQLVLGLLGLGLLCLTVTVAALLLGIRGTFAPAMSDTCSTCRGIARASLRFRSQRESCLHVLEQWYLRYHSDSDGKPGFDTDGLDFLDLLEATERLLYAGDQP